jgi:hypothetical protein
MANPYAGDSDFLRKIIDSFPAHVMVVDDDVKILECNDSTERFVGRERQNILLFRCGDILQCLHSEETPEGCGRAPLCRECVARNSVNEAFQGKACIRHRTKMEIIRDGKKENLYALVTATPFLYKGTDLVLLVIEDISIIAELQRLVPICTKCKKIRDDDQYWMAVEAYFKRHWDLDFSHGLCPVCYKEQMDELDKL